MTATFKRGIEDFFIEVDSGVEEKTSDIVSYIYSQLVQNGAKASGAFTANFNISEGTPDSSFNPDKTSDIQPNIAYKPYTKYFVTSGAPYANRLEHGWSHKQQPPTGMFSVVANAASHKFK